MSRARRPPAIRPCLLILRTCLLTVGVVFLSATASSSAAKPRVSHSKSSSARRTKCVTPAHRGKRRKASKPCPHVKKPNAKVPKPSAAPTWPTTASPLLAEPPGTLAPTSAGVPTAEAPRSDASPLETPPAKTPPVETPPVETPPVETLSTTTTLSSSTNPSTLDEAVTYTATLSASAATGTVEFKDGGATIAGCTAQTISLGSATCAAAAYGTAGSHSITATYSGDGNYLSSTSSALTQTVNQTATTTAVSSPANPSNVGQSIAYVATLDTANATGTVAFEDEGSPISGCTAQIVSSGTATCTVAGYVAAGEHTISATYSGDSNYTGSTSPVLDQVVSQATTTTTTTLLSSGNPSAVGQAVTYTATLNTTAATGTVEFEDEGSAINGCGSRAVSSGAAKCTVADYATTGSHSITATYSGDGNFLISTSSPLTQTVNQASTTTTLASSASPSTLGQAVTYTATVSPATATGTIEFQEEGIPIAGCASQIISSGSATCTVSGYAVAGSHSITAAYSGDGNYLDSGSPALTQETGKAAVTTTVSSEMTPSDIGQPVTYTATLSAIAATGTVTFEEEGAPISGCAEQNVGFGGAACAVTGYANAGSRSIVATYSGDENYLKSASPALTQTVKKAATTTTLAASVNPSRVGQAVSYTVTLNTTAATGPVAFKDAGTTIIGCGAQTVRLGNATCTVASYGTAGSHAITATYSGDSNYLTSTSSPLTQVVYKAGTIPTTTTMSSSLNPSTVGQAVTYTATLSPAAATGTVEFTSSGTTITGCTAQIVSSGSATCTVAFSAAGGPWIRAVYSGDNTYATSTSPYLTQTINKNASTTTLVSSANPSIVGQAVAYTATASPATATGTLTFKEDGIAIPSCTKLAITSGTTICTTTYSTAGWHSIIAVYNGDNTYATSTSPTLTQVIHGDPTAVALSSSLNPSTVGQAVTYTATLSPAAATGTVEFTSSGTTITGCTAQIVSSGSATCTVAFSAAGGPWIRAVYSGDNTYATSTSPSLTQTINKSASTTTLASSANPSKLGQAVAYTATASPATATGTLTFKEDGIAIPSCTKLAITPSTPTTCTATTYSTAGWHSIIAVYSGDNTHSTSTSSTLTQVINKAPTATTVLSSLNPSTVGHAVTYTAAVSPVTAAGTIAFAEEGKAITGCAAQTISSGSATCSVTGYANWGSYNVTATYSGDSNHLSSSFTSTQAIEPLPVGPAGPFRFFSPSSFWNEELSVNASLDPGSAAMVEAFNQEVVEEGEAGAPAAINTTSYSVPVYTMPADQPTVKVKVTTENVWATPALQAALNAVPLPPNAQPAAGTDKHLVVWQPSTGRLWEFWHLENTATGWQAAWGGAIENASSDSGAYNSEAWLGATTSWGASATSLSIAGGLITLEDLEQGEINHALAIGIPEGRAGIYASPAQRTDGKSTSPLSLPEGAHLRLDPSLDLGALHLPRLTLMMAEAAQRYGIVVRDHTANISFYAQDPTPTGTNPYTGAHGYFEGKTPAQLLASFPWNHLQLLKMALHKTS